MDFWHKSRRWLQIDTGLQRRPMHVLEQEKQDSKRGTNNSETELIASNLRQCLVGM